MDTSGNVVFDYEVTGSAVSSISTGNILDGDTDGWYTIIYRRISATSAGTSSLRFNGDSGNNYGYRGIYGTSTMVANTDDANISGINFSYNAAATGMVLTVATVYAKSGSVRLVNTTFARDVSGTTVGALITSGCVWNNTADNIISMSVVSAGNYIDVGSRLIILKGNALAVGTSPGTTGAWKRVATSVLGSAANGVSFTGLTGDTAIAYYLSYQIKSVTGSTGGYRIKLNSDTGNNYGWQYLYGDETTVVAGRVTTGVTLYGGNDTDVGGYIMCTNLIFAKSGFLRPIIANMINRAGTGSQLTYVFGQNWSNTANQITQMDIYQVNAGNYTASGSQFDLYALYT